MKITVTVLKEKFKLSTGHGARYRKDVEVIYKGLQARMTRPGLKEKTSIVVKVGKDTINESVPSQNQNIFYGFLPVSWKIIYQKHR